ncbi:hypothetical protein MCOR27_010991 [Pyricularia oryzae]|uniref:chitinase n=1 Tax=Pyricularia grisea TaxID=148305 RepID=A0ABQ8NW55_PYRGI|nr:hypothetical protein MCOR01_004440 [Pyricularia oryzae]KAI6302708.1 hypothetical protein MCOR33_001978 [Pyricularia grisea]KAH9431119.1 hypothetical protein MCOR02_008427 [Pyricularia oryzae]KAI6253317.1 hypothetical protein MCOR19_010114 [Pyricularia oryzae]KAI6266541.1 hypothetical protein MCOR27_010991 [Pyricularia oryzae]
MKFSLSALALANAVSATRWMVYYDQYHITPPPNKTLTAGITHVITAFAQSDLFLNSSGKYEPFKPISEIRGMFNNGTKVCMAIGGWGDNVGFSKAALTDESRKEFAKNVAATVDRLGYDCVDMDWEFPGGNGQDYKQNPNSGRVSEIETFPLLLQDIKAAIGTKELSIAVPGKEVDMIAYTAEQVPKINAAVDFINVMAYDLMNRRDNVTLPHTDVKGSAAVVDRYIALGCEPKKLNLGFAFYAKWFTTAKGVECTTSTGCETALLEDAEGNDTGLSGAFTFEAANFATTPTNLTLTTDASCGANTFNKCAEGDCCSQYGFCGNTAAHCGTGCQFGYGKCDGFSTKDSFQKAVANGKTDEALGAQWYWDSTASLYWSWDTPALMKQKINDIVFAKGLGGGYAWSLGEDTFDYSHLVTLRDGLKKKCKA